MSGNWQKMLYPVKGRERRIQPGGGMKRIEEVFGAKMREFTTVGIGGAAERLVFPRSVREIQEILASEGAANREGRGLGGGGNPLGGGRGSADDERRGVRPCHRGYRRVGGNRGSRGSAVPGRGEGHPFFLQDGRVPRGGDHRPGGVPAPTGAFRRSVFPHEDAQREATRQPALGGADVRLHLPESPRLGEGGGPSGAGGGGGRARGRGDVFGGG